MTARIECMPDLNLSVEKLVAAIGSTIAALLGGLKLWKVAARKWATSRELHAHRSQLLESIGARIEEMSARQIQIELTTHLIHAATGMTLVLAGIPAWRSSPDGQCLFATPLLAELLDLSEASARGWGWLSAVHPEDREQIRGDYVKACAERRIFSAFYRYKHHNGKVVYVSGTAYPVINPNDGLVVEYWGRAVEISRDQWEAQR